MAHEDNLAAALYNGSYGGNGSAETDIVGNGAVLKRHVEINPHEDTLVLYINIFDRHFLHV